MPSAPHPSSRPRRRGWLYLLVIIATVIIYLGDVATNLVADYLRPLMDNRKHWAWISLAVALLVAIITAIRGMRPRGDPAQEPPIDAGIPTREVNDLSITTGDRSIVLGHSQVQGPVQVIEHQEIHQYHHPHSQQVDTEGASTAWQSPQCLLAPCDCHPCRRLPVKGISTWTACAGFVVVAAAFPVSIRLLRAMNFHLTK